MALSEVTVLASIELLFDAKAINVRFEDKILRDSTVISSSNRRAAFCDGQRTAFLTALSPYAGDTAVVYSDAVGLTDDAPVGDIEAISES